MIKPTSGARHSDGVIALTGVDCRSVEISRNVIVAFARVDRSIVSDVSDGIGSRAAVDDDIISARVDGVFARAALDGDIFGYIFVVVDGNIVIAVARVNADVRPVEINFVIARARFEREVPSIHLSNGIIAVARIDVGIDERAVDLITAAPAFDRYVLYNVLLPFTTDDIIAVARIDRNFTDALKHNIIVAVARLDVDVSAVKFLSVLSVDVAADANLVIAAARIDGDIIDKPLMMKFAMSDVNHIVAVARLNGNLTAVQKFELLHRTDSIDGDIGGISAVKSRHITAETDRCVVDIILDAGDTAAVGDGGSAGHDIENIAAVDHCDLLVADVFESERTAVLACIVFYHRETKIVADHLGTLEYPLSNANGIVGVETVDGIVAAFVIDDLLGAFEADHIITAQRLNDRIVDGTLERIGLIGADQNIAVDSRRYIAQAVLNGDRFARGILEADRAVADLEYGIESFIVAAIDRAVENVDRVAQIESEYGIVAVAVRILDHTGTHEQNQIIVDAAVDNNVIAEAVFDGIVACAAPDRDVISVVDDRIVIAEASDVGVFGLIDDG